MPPASESTQPMTVAKRPLRKILLIGLVLFLAAAFTTAWRAWSSHQSQRSWINKIEALGAEVITAGYGPTGPLSRIPIVREAFVRSQIEIFLPNTDVAQQVLPLLKNHPEIGRLWVHANNVDAATVATLTEEFPQVQMVRYTRKGE